MFNGSFLRVCRIFRFVKKIRFCLLESGRTKPWADQALVPGFGVSAECQSIGTIFIQGPSIVLPVWRCIMFNGSYLRACKILRFVNKI